MKIFTATITALLLITSNNSYGAAEGYSFNASRFAQPQPLTATEAEKIPYETIKHHTRHRKYHSALNVTRTVSSVTIAFHTKQELTELRGPRVNGFSRVRYDGTCEIHVMMPYHWNDDDAMRTVGHELMHCFGATHEKGTDKQKRPTATPALHRIAEQPSQTPVIQVAARQLNGGYKTPLLVEKSREGAHHF